MKLKGRRFETVSDIQREPQAALDSMKGNHFRGAFKRRGKRKSRCDDCIRFQSDYSEGGGISFFT